ncbi:MAG TPA: SDR family oxidoreductase [Vicinamibacterales bacterium]|nr:SDR family oxidoreductase [Vicinamibacterales bacterium]
MILVAGGTGNLGRCLVQLLLADGLRVRVLSRDPARAARLGDGVDVVAGDVRDPGSLLAAMDGVTTVLSAVHGFAGPGGVTPESVDRLGNFNLIAAATAAGVRRFVLVSITGASANATIELFRAKYDAEMRLRGSQLEWTIIRPTAYVETWAMVMREMLRTTGAVVVFGRGDNPINFVSVTDVAHLIRRAIADGALRRRSIDIGGPENMTFNQFASALLAVTRDGGSIRHVPRGVLSLMLRMTRWVKRDVARKIEASLVMDTRDMTLDGSDLQREFPDLPLTDVATALRSFVSRKN